MGTRAPRDRESAPFWRAPGSRIGVALLAVSALVGCGSPELPLQPPPVYECFRILDPYERPGTWHRGNLHMHSSHSDGSLDAAKLMDLYTRSGFSVLCISDHNQWGDQDGGIVPQYQTDEVLHDWNGDGELHPVHQLGSGVEAYVRDYSVPPPEWKKDAWYRDDVRPAAPVLISGAEMSHLGWHFGVLGLPPGPIERPGGSMAYMQRAHAAGGLVFLAHPGEWNESPGILAGHLDFSTFDGIEIMNGLRLAAAKQATGDVHQKGIAPDCIAGDAVADATPLWDGLLSRGYRLWGFANDDAHTWQGASEAYPFTSWSMLLTKESSEAAFLEALHGGAFYGSTGLYFRELGVRGDSILAWAPAAETIRFVGWGGRVLQETRTERAAYLVTGNEGYVRAEARAAPRDHAWPQQAWSQPFYMEAASCDDGGRPKRGAAK